MKSILAQCSPHRVIWGFVCLLAIGAGVYFFTPPSSAQVRRGQAAADRSGARNGESAELVAFRQRVGRVRPVIVELKEDPGAVRLFNQPLKTGESMFEKLGAYAVELSGKQDELLNALPERGVSALMRTTDAKQVDGSIRHIEYRFTYLLNGFVAYVAAKDLEELKAQPEVLAVHKIEDTRFLLEQAIDYSLGTHMLPSDRRFAVYGANQELEPQPIADHPENPRLTAIDGFEGQGMNLAVIDSGTDWRHPMFGGTGNTTPTPRVSGQPASANDNRKVIYYYAMSSPGNPTDDFGHGTHVASSAAGFKVDGNTTPRTGYGLGRDNTGIGPTMNGAMLHGTAPQARIMAYKVCGPAPQCPGDIPLSMEDAASPYTLVSTGNQGLTPVAKPVADVINLSLGDTAGSSTGASSKAANNAALNGTIVVASAGNAGPGAGTVGAPSAATMAISVAASLDPGSVAGADVLAPVDQIPAEPCDDTPRPAACDTGTQPAGPAPEYGAASNANAASSLVGLKLFPVAGGGPIRDGSLSAHYVYVDLITNLPSPTSVPESVRNRIALVRFSGTFASGANPVATKNPSAILLISNTESATAVQVINGIPTYTTSVTNANTLLDMLPDGSANGTPNPPTTYPAHGAVSLLPLRASETTSLDGFSPAMASFSSRGPNDHATANYRQIKPDVTAPGVGITGAATPTGLPDDTVGMASTTGYTTANGTSFSGPITAGAISVVRQRVRNALGLDTVNLNDSNYRNKRFDTVTVARALLQNSATNLRTGRGVPESDPAPTGSINDLGSGHINVAGALDLRAIMVSPTLLLADADSATTGNQSEFTRPTRNAPPLDANGNIEVLLPTASFGNQPVAGLQNTKTATRRVIIRDIGGGGGTYNLSYGNNRNVDGTNFAVSFSSDAGGATPITSVRVPAGGRGTYYVRVAANGTNIVAGTEFQWYVYAAHASSGQAMRMPFYYRATSAAPSGLNAPNQTPPTVGGTPGLPPACSTDPDGNYILNWIAPVVAAGQTLVGYRVQEATSTGEIYFDNANEPLAGGANSKWSGSAQWTTQVNPTTASPSYFVPDAANQNESLTMVAPGVTIPSGSGASLSYVTTQSTEEGFDYIHVEVSNNNGATFNTLGSFSGLFTGTREFDLTPYAGSTVRIRFRMTSDLVVSDVGTYVEDIRIATNNFTTLGDVGPTTLNFSVTGRTAGTRHYRIAGIFSTPDGNVIGPYSNTRCVTVP